MAKSNMLLVFVGSVGLILVAILFTSIIGNTRNKSIRQDTRTRAGENATTAFLGTAGTYDAAANILTVDNLMFDTADGKTLGSWKIAVPKGYNAAQYPAGTDIRITASPATFNISDNTLTAVEIKNR